MIRKYNKKADNYEKYLMHCMLLEDDRAMIDTEQRNVERAAYNAEVYENKKKNLSGVDN